MCMIEEGVCIRMYLLNKQIMNYALQKGEGGRCIESKRRQLRMGQGLL